MAPPRLVRQAERASEPAWKERAGGRGSGADHTNPLDPMRVLLLLGLVPLSYALRSASRTSAAGGRQRGALRASRASAVDAGPQGGAADRAIHETDSFVARKAALVEGLRREYTSFFQPMEENLYAPGVTFSDPLISLEGVSAYKNNVNMLAGDSMLGKILFTDCGLVMHNVTTDSPESRTLCTRWTLQFRFKLLPWQPLAQFTGISQYTLDDEARVLRQEDFWDSINLEAGGTYKPAGKAAGLLDMLKQFGPRIERRTAARQELRHDLLRRAARYEVRRYPEYLAVGTECEPWEGGILKVFADASFAASVAKELTPQVRSSRRSLLHPLSCKPFLV